MLVSLDFFNRPASGILNPTYQGYIDLKIKKGGMLFSTFVNIGSMYSLLSQWENIQSQRNIGLFKSTTYCIILAQNQYE